MTGRVTSRDLKLIHAAHPATLIAIEWGEKVTLQNHSYLDFVDFVHRGIAYAACEMSQNPKGAKVRDENDLTREVVGYLRTMGFDAEFDATVGGHADVVVKFGDYQWIGEAKIFTSVPWLYKGYLQLLTRYSTGMVDQDCGGMLIYIKTGSCPDKMEDWKKRLGEYVNKKAGSGATISTLDKPAMAFESAQKHRRSGRNYRVTHVPFLLTWDPAV